jgi:hypothetical protein
MHACGYEKEEAMDTSMTISETKYRATKVVQRTNDYFTLDGTGKEHGPYATLEDALDAGVRLTGADVARTSADWLAEIGYEAAFPASFSHCI